MMSPHQAVAVAVRIFAAWLGITVLRDLASFASLDRATSPDMASLSLLLSWLLYLLLHFGSFQGPSHGNCFPPITQSPTLQRPRTSGSQWAAHYWAYGCLPPRYRRSFSTRTRSCTSTPETNGGTFPNLWCITSLK